MNDWTLIRDAMVIEVLKSALITEKSKSQSIVMWIKFECSVYCEGKTT